MFVHLISIQSFYFLDSVFHWVSDNQASDTHGNDYNCLKNDIASYALSANSLVMVLLSDPDFTVGIM